MDDKNLQNGTSQPNKKKRIWYILGGVLIALVSFFAGFGVRWFSLDAEMRTLINVKAKIDREYYEDISDEVFYNTLFDAINTGILDDYSEYMTADGYADSNAELAGNRSGLGIVFLTKTDDGAPQLFISRVCGNSPAEEAGLLEGERVLGFGKTQTELTQSVVFDEFSEFLNTCAEAETFYLQVEGQSGKRIVPISKQVYVESYTFYRTNSQAYTFTGESAATLTERGEPLACLDDDTAYIRLIRFTGNASKQFGVLMDLFKRQGKKNLVLDLRGNGGGYLGTMQEIASYLCKNTTAKRPVVAIADYGERREIFRAAGNLYKKYFEETSRICILADNNSASASECLMGAMLDYGTVSYADICLIEENGEARTYGKGIMQTTYVMDLFKQDALKLTTATIHWPLTNHCIHGRGILATDGTRFVERSYGYETELTAAIQALFA